jgi:hypothetical protein
VVPDGRVLGRGSFERAGGEVDGGGHISRYGIASPGSSAHPVVAFELAGSVA